ncbi:MAG: carboxypeptidase M32 [Anaerolineales bacterium]|nr:carboxypeptidase M32 [Anaerolineales bacterium]
MQAKLNDLKNRLAEVADLSAAGAVLSWDQATYMPKGSAAARGRQMATLASLAQAKFTDAEIGRLLDALEPWAAEQPAGSDDAALVRKTRKDYDKQVKVSADWVARANRHMAESYQAWTEARPANDFKAVAERLQTTLDLSREYANFFPGYAHIADPLIDGPDPGMRAESIRSLFAELRQELVPLVQAITAQAEADDRVLRKDYPEEQQLAFGLGVIRDFGFDFERGRQDKTHHPFCTSFSISDVRITTRVKPNYLADALFSTLHEAGHAMYEQGIHPAYEATPLAGGTSSGVHESQSRTWENIVGRSRGFWEHYFPKLQQQFPSQLKDADVDGFYRAINKVERSLIRTDADEVTYNLHVMLRFDLELQLLEGSLEIKDLPAAWQARYQSDLGIQAPSDVDGVLQDVHWYAGLIGGAFQGYTLGNIMSALFYDAALQAHPSIPGEIAAGQFGTLHGWLRENIYQYGAKYEPNELVERISGGQLRIAPYMRYLKDKYGQLYRLD